MNTEDKFFHQYRQKMDETRLTADQKQNLIAALQKENEQQSDNKTLIPKKRIQREYMKKSRVFAPGKAFMTGLATLSAAAICWIALPHALNPADPVVPAPSATTEPDRHPLREPSPPADQLPLLPLDDPAFSNPGEVGGLGTVGWFAYTKNPDADLEWPEKLPVYQYTTVLPERKLDPYDQDFMYQQLSGLIQTLAMEAEILEDTPDPYLLNSSVYALTDWGRLDLMNADTGHLFVNGRIPFSASQEEEAIAAMEEVISQYSFLFPLDHPAIRLLPTRKLAGDGRYTFAIYEESTSSAENLVSASSQAIQVLCDAQGIQSILYPLPSAMQVEDYPVLSREEAIERLNESLEDVSSVSKDQIWLVWKADSSGTWNIPYYRIYLSNENGQTQSFDVCAIQPEYGQ